MNLANKIFTASIDSAMKDAAAEEYALPHRAMAPDGKPSIKLRTTYQIRLWVRALMVAATTVLYFWKPSEFQVAEGLNFFKRFSVLHLIWLYWLCELLLPLFPAKGMISIGSLKHMQRLYIPDGKIQTDRLFAYIKRSTKDSLKVFAVWVLYMVCLTVGVVLKLFRTKELVGICLLLNLLDVIFILYWCPFRALFMKNRCCTTCRIFNWDHIMIYSALFFVPGFFGYSLLTLSIFVFAVWEICFFLHPQRFWEGSNCSLRCSNCTDRICVHAHHLRWRNAR